MREVGCRGGGTDLLLALDGANDSPGRSSSSDNVLVGYGKEISLFDREFRVEGGDRFHLGNHLRIASECVSCCLLRALRSRSQEERGSGVGVVRGGGLRGVRM